MSAGRPSWASRPVPPNVRQAWSYVRDWSWQSPLRLRGEHPEGRGAYLVVIEAGPAEPRYIGQGIGPGTSAERVSEIYADLHVHLARNIAHETACLDGAPVRADHDHDRCRFCGLLASEHEVPDGGGPVYQATHVTWGPGTPAVTTAEAEAAIYVELEAMKYRESPAASWSEGDVAYGPECGAGSIFNGMPGDAPCWLCPACGHERGGTEAVSGNLPGQSPRPLVMRSQDDRGPAYTAAVERSEAAFAAVHALLGDRPRLVGSAGELAELAAALPPETSVWLDGSPRIERGQRPGPGWVEAVGATMATVVERPVTPVRDSAGREHDVMAPAVQLGVFLLPGPDGPVPQETEASGYYARAIETLENDGPGVSLAAVAALVHHLADLVGPGSYSPAGYLPEDSPAAAEVRALAAELRGVAVRFAALAPAAGAAAAADPEEPS